LQDASSLGPKRLQPQDKFLKRQRIGLGWIQGSFGSEQVTSRL